MRYQMEITLLGIVYGVLVTLGNKFFPEGVKGHFTVFGAAEEAVGELLEELIEFLLKAPKRISDRDKKKKLVLKAVGGVIEKVKALSNSERMELIELLNEAYRNDVSFKNTYEKCINALKRLKNPKKCIAEFEKVVEAVIKPVEKDVSEGLKYKSGTELAENYFKRKNLPVALIDIMNVISDCVYEIKYVKIANNDRDVVKLIQLMLKENNASLIDGLQSYFSLILQQNARLNATRGGVEATEGEWRPALEIAKLEKSDPFTWVELKCPKCGAGGDCVERYSELIVCKACGGKYSIFDDPSEEIRDILGEMNANLSAELKAALGKVEERLGAEIKKLDGSISVSLSDLDVKIRKMSRQVLLSNAEMLESIAYAADDLSDRNKAIEAAVRGLVSDLRSARNERSSLAEALDDMERKLDERDVLMLTKFEEQKALLEEILNKISKGDFISPRVFAPAAPAPAEMRYCPVCRRNSRLWEGDRHTPCSLTESERGKVLHLKIVDREDSYIWIERINNAEIKYPHIASMTVECDFNNLSQNLLAADVELRLLRGLSILVIDSPSRVKVSSRAIESLITHSYFDGCSSIILTKRIEVCNEVNISGWEYNADEGLLEKKRR